jgi:hypothetical protein
VQLCAKHGYGLAAVSTAGLNAFLTADSDLDPEASWRRNTIREKLSGISHGEQWASLKTMPLIRV